MYKLKSTKSRHSMDGFVQHDNSFKCSCSSKETGDVKWWLDHNGLTNCYSLDQLNVLDAEINTFVASDAYGNAKESGVKHLIEDYYAQNDFTNANLKDLNLRQPNKLSSDLDSDMIGLKSIQPWWHSVDTCSDLAFLASQNSSQFVGAQTVHSAKGLHDCFSCDELIHQQVAEKEPQLFKLVNSAQGNDPLIEDVKGSYFDHRSQRNIAISVDNSVGNSGLLDGAVQESDGTFSSYGDSTKHKMDDSLNTNNESCGDMNRSELLVALCHSQTRAREAENLAQQACDEKDHIVNLFFRQASYLFAYRQWLRMLQLETLCLQLRSKNQLNSFSSVTILRKNRHRGAKKKPEKPKRDVSKYVVAFALGLSLAGAGLLVGLTIGDGFSLLSRYLVRLCTYYRIAYCKEMHDITCGI